MNRDYFRGLALTAGAAAFFLGMATLVSAMAFSTKLQIEVESGQATNTNVGLDTSTMSFKAAMIAGGLLSAVGVVLGVVGLSQLTEMNVDWALFQRYRLGLGYVVTLMAVQVLLALAGLGANGWLDIIFPRPTVANATSKSSPESVPQSPIKSTSPTVTTDSVAKPPVVPSKEEIEDWITKAGKKFNMDAVSRSALLLCSMAMAILGVLFSVLDSMAKKATTDEKFSSDVFWSGLWYRTGESVLFAIVLFLSIRRMSPDGSNDFWLPLLALFMGMFIKTAEKLVFGLGTRTLEASEALLSLGGGRGAAEKTAAEQAAIGKVGAEKAAAERVAAERVVPPAAM